MTPWSSLPKSTVDAESLNMFRVEIGRFLDCIIIKDYGEQATKAKVRSATILFQTSYIPATISSEYN